MAGKKLDKRILQFIFAEEKITNSPLKVFFLTVTFIFGS